MPKKTAIQIKNLVKIYQPANKNKKNTGEVEALKGVDLEIPEGSFFGLLGPNGAGKSTLINIIAGLVNKTSGKVKIAKFDIDKNPREAKYCIGVVPQEVSLDPFFKIHEMLEFHAGFYGVPKNKRKTGEILNALGLADKANSTSRKLSGGMKRRTLIAKALVHSPPIIILDEPTAGVDVELREQLWNYVRELNKSGVTILLTTHYLEEAEQLCDRIAVINHGEIIACDSKQKMMKMLDNKQIIIELAQTIDKIPPLLTKYNAELTARNEMTISYKSTAHNFGDIIGAVQKENLDIKELSTKEPKLEDVFRYLTKN